MRIDKKLTELPTHILDAFASYWQLTSSTRKALLDRNIEALPADWDKVKRLTYTVCKNMRMAVSSGYYEIDSPSLIDSWFDKRLKVTLLAGTREQIAIDANSEVYVCTLPIRNGTLVILADVSRNRPIDSEDSIYYVPMPEVINKVKPSTK